MAARRVVVNLAPASLRKDGPGLDLPVAVGVLVAARQPVRAFAVPEIVTGVDDFLADVVSLAVWTSFRP